MKTSIMTSTYNITRFGIHKYIENSFNIIISEGKIYKYVYKGNSEYVLTSSQFQILVKNAIFNMHPFMLDLLNYFNIHSKLGLGVVWITPSN